MYKKSFYLTEPVGNNAFSYEKRANKSLFVPSLMNGNFSDIKQGSETVFEDFDEKNILRSCTGLRNFVRMEWNGIPMRVFDNHNHALYFWYEARSHGIIGTKNTLVHIDEHSDLWENANNLPSGELKLKEVFHFTNHQCNVGNYIEPTLREGLIEKVLRIEDTIGMGKYASYEK